MITIVFAHPWHGSFNYAILDQMKDRFSAENRPFQVIDLVADGFNPTTTEAELALYSKGQTDEALVEKYVKMLQDTDELIFIFPIWWGMMPADLKGFFDKVFLPGKAYSYDENGAMVPLFRISKTWVVTTSQGATVMYGQFIEGYLIPMVLNAVGITGVSWRNCDQTSHGPAGRREAFLKQVVAEV